MSTLGGWLWESCERRLGAKQCSMTLPHLQTALQCPVLAALDPTPVCPSDPLAPFRPPGPIPPPCRLAFVAALGAELSTGETVLRQLADEPTGVLLAGITFITASLIPLLNSTKREAFGPFTPAVSDLRGAALCSALDGPRACGKELKATCVLS